MLSIARQLKAFTDEAIVFFSTGKDSIASLSLCVDAGIKVTPVYLYFVKDLSFTRKIIKHYEDRFNCKVLQYPQPDIAGIYRARKGKHIPAMGQKEVEAAVRKDTGLKWIVYGYRKGESLERRGMLKNREVDPRYNKAYPIANWSAKDVLKYIKMKKLPLPITYRRGYRDINAWKGEPLLWIYRNYPDDYEKVKQMFPWVEGELLRARDNE